MAMMMMTPPIVGVPVFFIWPSSPEIANYFAYLHHLQSVDYFAAEYHGDK